MFCFAHLQSCHNGWASNILIVVDTSCAGIHHSRCPSIMIRLKMGKTKHPIVYSLILCLDVDLSCVALLDLESLLYVVMLSCVVLLDLESLLYVMMLSYFYEHFINLGDSATRLIKSNDCVLSHVYLARVFTLSPSFSSHTPGSKFFQLPIGE